MLYKDSIGISKELASSWKYLSNHERGFVIACTELNPKFQSLVLQVQIEELCDIPQAANEKKSLRLCKRWLVKVFRYFVDFWRRR